MTAIAWRSALLASLLSGTALGQRTTSSLSDPAELDRLALSFTDDLSPFTSALDVRRAHLNGAPEAAIPVETLEVLAPLADRLGLARERAELEDASFRLVDPEAYHAVSSRLPTDDGPHLNALLEDTRDLLAQAGVDAVVTGRVKSVYSVYDKMLRKDRSVEQILDRVALRVHVDDEASCYRVLDLLHGRHEALPAELDDYIANPKANGYQSLHTVVVSQLGDRAVEFQVRTHAMHHAAEHGVAAHWRYKLSASA
jgi:(p)ppGpp synthase/HD superfamily hydrolase